MPINSFAKMQFSKLILAIVVRAVGVLRVTSKSNLWARLGRQSISTRGTHLCKWARWTSLSRILTPYKRNTMKMKLDKEFPTLSQAIRCRQYTRVSKSQEQTKFKSIRFKLVLNPSNTYKSRRKVNLAFSRQASRRHSLQDRVRR